MVTDLPFDYDTTPANPAAPKPKCRRHDYERGAHMTAAFGVDGRVYACAICGKLRDEDVARRNKNNGARGRREELTVAREVGGRKVGPLGHPWDVEMPGYARLQVKKLANPPSLRFVAAELTKVAAAPGVEMPGFVWVEPGRGGERLIVFRLKDFSERHGIEVADAG